ncbi:hypothetical protein ACFYPT_42385 [Streptomyces sp. NPDC005529]|uniref:hypothetical protein n=1 Tax=unclassified Streptomyces TaxID=2593676 RepID=UPI0033ACB01B
MSAQTGEDDDGAVRGARVARLETLRDMDVLLRELGKLHSDLLACEDDDGEQVRDVLHAAGVMTGVWLDDIACRIAESEHDADELFASAWQFVDSLELEPGGFLTRDDPALFTTLRGSAASMLARLWVTGYLLGPVPKDAWPDRELAVLLLRTLEHHADALALAKTLEPHHSPGEDGAPRDEEPETGGEPDLPGADLS